MFAIEKFDEAAGATQVAMRLLPKDKWGVVVGNHKELYGNLQDYTNQLRALEKGIKDNPGNPALRFLAGFQYAYLGFPKEAVDQLNMALKLEPRDEMSRQLRNEMQAKLPKSSEPGGTTPKPEASQNTLRSDVMHWVDSLKSKILHPAQ